MNYPSRQTTTPSKQKKTFSIRTVLEAIFFIGWLFCTAVAGYFIGHTQKISAVKANCPPVVSQSQIASDSTLAAKPPCIPRKVNAATATTIANGAGAGNKGDETGEEVDGGAEEEEENSGAGAGAGGYTIDELERMWTCSHAQATNITQVNQQVYPKENNLDKTKWKSILTVEPKAFFEKYLSQYPGDTRAVQPVVVFSHKPLNSFEEIEDVCKVVDVAIVPDEPGVCVAVTETFHDVASYHMLHADKQADGTFALTSNSIEGRTLPEEADYAMARALLLEFFDNTDSVDKAIKSAPKFANNQIAVGVVLLTMDDLELFQNSFASAAKVGVSASKFCIFTTSKDIAHRAGESLKSVRTITLSDLSKIGGDTLAAGVRRHFLQAWLAFSVAASGNKMLWQSPGTVWFSQPDDIVTNAPVVETMWAYKGRNDVRAAPFFTSLDFFVATGAERSVHLMHEIVLHFDLVLAWKSLDALAAYRLAENNARYGTTTYLLPPHVVLHTELMGHNSQLLKDAISAARGDKKPKVVVVPAEGRDASESKKMLQDAGMWFIV
jgi:hypothetical protein